ncbi:hypothetical protein [Paludibaculum fermentans]|uniref:hypothetical protein n=1 Tax=Paludibaculum fermentans TaxID=1473598 RepID=UPI003EB802F2
MKIVVLGIMLAGLAGRIPAQNLICNGGFEAPQFGLSTTFTDIPCWHSTSGQKIEVQNKSAGYVQGVIGTQYVELDVNTNSDIYQDIATIPGQRYLIRFWGANRTGSSRSAFRLLWDDALLGTVTRDSGQTTFGRFVTEVVATKTVSRVALAADGPSDSLGDLVDEVSVTPIPAAGSRLGYAYYLPHFADGAEWGSSLSFGNSSPNFAATVQYTVYGDDGAILDPLLNGSLTLAPLASTVIESPRPAALRTGWVKVLSSEPLQAMVIFRSVVTGRLDLEATVLARELTTETVAPYDNVAFTTGLAAVNPGTTPLTLTFIFHGTAGGILATSTLPLGPNAHTSFAIPTKFPLVAERNGLVEIRATDAAGNPANFVPLGLRFTPGGAFTTLPY